MTFPSLIPSFRQIVPGLFFCLASVTPSVAGTAVDGGKPTSSAATPPPQTKTEDFSLGGVLFPHIHVHSVLSDSTTDPSELAVGHHDPNNNGLTFQGVEFGMSGRFTDWLEAFGTFHLSYNEPLSEWQHEFEEWFGKVKNLPGGFEIRGGKFLNRFGLHNAVHLHGWDWADQYLVEGRFLGDDGLTSIGGEVSWKLPVRWDSVLGASVGVAPELDHEHAHGEEEAEPLYEGEGAAFDDILTTVNWTNQFNWNDFHQFRAGVSGAWGENQWGRTTSIYGAHVEYQWRENGFQPGGRYLRWRTEAMVRRFGAISGHLPGEEEHHGEEEHEEEAEEAVRRATLSEAGVYTDLRYGWDFGLELGVRGEWVEGISSANLDERYRISPGVTYYFNGKRNAFIRIQYNYDDSSERGDDHSILAQVGFNWGGREVR